MNEFKQGDSVLVSGTYDAARGDDMHSVDFGGPIIRVHRINIHHAQPDVRPYTEPDAAHPLDAAVAELGRVTGLSGDDLLTAAKRAILRAAREVLDAGIDLRAARDEAMDGIRRVIGDVMPSVLEHAAALPPDDNTDDMPF